MSNEKKDKSDLPTERKNLIFDSKTTELENMLIDHDKKVSLLTKKLNNFEKILDKTKEFLLLELEASLDKHIQIQNTNEKFYNDLIFFLKNNESTFNSLNNNFIDFKKNDDCKKKDFLIHEQDEKLFELNNDLKEKSNVIDLLNRTILQLKIINSNKESEIKELNELIIKNENQIRTLSDENIALKLDFDEKDETIRLLKEEIMLLKLEVSETGENL